MEAHTSMQPIITLLTDFGLQDGYVASMKGVILSLCPEARLVDVSHLIPPHDIRAGAFVLETSWRWFPAGTIHLAVVDPGVGTQRSGLVIKAGRHCFVGPDNGLFSGPLTTWRKECEVRSIEDPRFFIRAGGERKEAGPTEIEISTTFHGRDVFAPVAAHLALGVPLKAFGPPCSAVIAQWAAPKEEDGALIGEVIYVDRFGNAITNITGVLIKKMARGGRWSVRAAGTGGAAHPQVVKTYGEAAPGAAVALIGSSDFLEIAINQGNAALALGLSPGSPVSVYRAAS